MATIDQSGLRGKIRDQPISQQLETVLQKAAEAAGVDVVYVTSGGQPGSSGQRIGSTRHDGGRAADLQLFVDGRAQTFSDEDASDVVERFVIAAAANGAMGIGAGVRYMGPATLHIGFGRSSEDRARIVWGAGGAGQNAPQWLSDAASAGWNNPPAWAFRPRSGRDTEGTSIRRFADSAIEVPRRFSIEVVRAAQASQRTLGIPASITLAQWAVESAYGTRMPANSNNPFGIKAKRGEPSVVAWTKEVIQGRTVSVQQSFRVFASLDEAFVKHAQLLATAPVYARARSFLRDPDRFADALTGVYATDPTYGALLKSVMRGNDLYRFDQLGEDDGPTLMGGAEAEAGGVLGGWDRSPAAVRTLQRQLTDLGYNLGEIDGRFGPLTAGALLTFQNENGLPTTGVLDQTTQEALETAPHRRLDDDRTRKTEKELAADGSRIVKAARQSRVLGWITSAFGALGIGNSAIVNGAGSTGGTGVNLPEGLLPFLADAQRLLPGGSAPDLTRLSSVARTLQEQLAGRTLSPDLLRIADQLRRGLPADLLAGDPEIGRGLDAIGRMAPAAGRAMTTIFDVLPTFFTSDTVLQVVAKGVAAVAGSTLPGFGGSAALLAAGLVGRFLANRIAAARVDDHRKGANVAPLGK